MLQPRRCAGISSCYTLTGGFPFCATAQHVFDGGGHGARRKVSWRFPEEKRRTTHYIPLGDNEHVGSRVALVTAARSPEIAVTQVTAPLGIERPGSMQDRFNFAERLLEANAERREKVAYI